MKILIVCLEGNSCRSSMAEAFLQKMDRSLEVYSAGFHPEKQVHPIAVEVMNEIGMDISAKIPRNINEFEGMSVDYLITICNRKKDEFGPDAISSNHSIHLGFEDPEESVGDKDQLIENYRDIRDEIKNDIGYFYTRILAPSLVSK